MAKGAGRLPLAAGSRLMNFDEIGFASESDLAAGAAKATRRPYVKIAAVVVAFLLLSASAFIIWPEAARADASLRVESDPVGAEVRLDGQVRGRTPLVLTLNPGTYAVAVGDGPTARERRVTLAESERASVHHVLTSTAATGWSPLEPPAALATLSVVTRPPGGTVIVDGTPRGAAPLVVRNLRAGVHQLTVKNQGMVYEDRVTLEAGNTSRVVVGTNSAATSAGWLSVQAPLRLQVHEDGTLIGTTDTERFMLPTGEHRLTFSDPETGFSNTQAVRIGAGSTTGIAIPIPRAPVNVNAIPWADVSIDNERIGETPIGNHMLMLGTHDVELRHPQLGTKRLRFSVSLKGPNRVAVNMREP